MILFHRHYKFRHSESCKLSIYPSSLFFLVKVFSLPRVKYENSSSFNSFKMQHFHEEKLLSEIRQKFHLSLQ